MTIMDPGYSEAAAHTFTWAADKALSNIGALAHWGWKQSQWQAAQDRYDEKVIALHGKIRIFGQTKSKPLKDIFTDVHVLETPTARQRFDPEKLREYLWNQHRDVSLREDERRPAESFLADHDKLFLLGRPGAGKTTFLKWLAVREARREAETPILGKTPIFVSLREYARADSSLLDYVIDQFEVCNFPSAAMPFVEQLLVTGKALVLFDGLDEVPKTPEDNVDRRAQVAEEINHFSRRFDKCHVVVTCRIAASEFQFDPCFAYFEMVDFSPDQVATFIGSWFWDEADQEGSAELADDMLAEWELPEQKGVRDLGRNPLLLTLLCLYYAKTRRFPVRRVEIYERAMDALLRKWDSSRNIRRGSLYRRLSPERKEEMFAKIAYDGFSNDKVLFTASDLTHQIKAYLVPVPEMPEPIDIDGRAVLQEIVAQHGIFMEQAQGLFSFAHLTFQEYFAAKHIHTNATHDTLATVARHVTDDRWREVFLLTASLLSQERAADFLACIEAQVRHIASQEPMLVDLLTRVEKALADPQITYRGAAARAYLYANTARSFVIARQDPPALDWDPDCFGPTAIANALDPVLGLDAALSRGCAATYSLHAPDGLSAPTNVLDVIAFAKTWQIPAVWPKTIDSGVDLKEGSGLVLRILNSHTFGPAMQVFLTEICRKRDSPATSARIAALEMPETKDDEDWAVFWCTLHRIVDQSRLLDRFKYLESVSFAVGEAFDLEAWDDDSLDAAIAYLSGTKLLYECLQLASLPDRREREGRLLTLT